MSDFEQIIDAVEPSGWLYGGGFSVMEIRFDQREVVPRGYTEDPLYTERQIRAMMAQVVEACVKACEAERLSDLQNESDAAYDHAIEHCVEAIRATLPTAPIGDA